MNKPFGEGPTMYPGGPLISTCAVISKEAQNVSSAVESAIGNPFIVNYNTTASGYDTQYIGKERDAREAVEEKVKRWNKGE